MAMVSSPRPRRSLAAAAMRGAVALSVAAGILACAALDLSPLDNGQCPEGQKACAGETGPRCVPTDDPTTGCARESCTPCTLYATAVTICDLQRQCAVSVCLETFGDCNPILAGCETEIGFDVNNCGKCGNVCPLGPNVATAACNRGTCGINLCRAGFGNCDADPINGCETDLSTSARHCGRCGNVCPSGTCAQGSCT